MPAVSCWAAKEVVAVFSSVLLILFGVCAAFNPAVAKVLPSPVVTGLKASTLTGELKADKSSTTLCGIIN